MATVSLIPNPTTRNLARELGTIRREIETIKAGGRATQLDRSSLMYPLIIRDPRTGEVLGTFGAQNGSASLIPIGGSPPPAPTAPILTALIEGVLVEWDGKFVDETYVVPLLAPRPPRTGMRPLTVATYQDPEKVKAAAAILARLQADGEIFEDWTWHGMPSYIGNWNDELLEDNPHPTSAPAAEAWLLDYVITHTVQPTGKIQAAEQILDRLQAGQTIFEDWTWHGMPSIVGTWNDALLGDAESYGLTGDDWTFGADARDYLDEYIDKAQIPPPAPPPGEEPDGGSESVGGSGGILTPDTPEKIAAAEAILNRFRANKPINDDWTFPGCPAYVTEHGPVLKSEWFNRGTEVEYLQRYLDTRTTRPHNFGYVGIHYGPAEDFVTDASNMVGTLTGAGTFPISPVSETIYVRLVGYNNSTPPVSGPASDTVSMTPNRVVATEILDGIVTEVALADQAVSTAKVQLQAIQTQLLAAAAVTGPNIAPSAVGTDKIAALAVTADQMAANSVHAGAIQASAVTAATIAAFAVSADKILANSIGAGQIAADSIDATNLRANSVTASKIAALAVTAGAIAANAVTAGHLVAGAVTADKLAALLVMATRIVAGDPNGSRAEVNGAGIFAFAGSLNTFSLRSDGTAFLRGQIEAGTGNDRIVIQPGGSGRPDIQFFALPTNPAYINAVPVQVNATETDGVGIGVNSGPRPGVTGRQTTMLVRPDRATLGYTQVGTGGARGGQVYVDANFADLAQYSDSGTLQCRFRLGADGAVCDDPITAPAFPISSDARVKTAPRTLAERDPEWDPFEALKGRIGVWRYREMEPDRDHLGPVDALDFPQWMHRTRPAPDNDTVTINLADMVGVALLMADRLDDRVKALEAAARVR